MACEGKGDNSDIPQLHQPVHNLSIKTLLDIYSKYVKTNESKSDRENLDKIKTLALDLFLTKCISRELETGEFPRIYNMKSILNQLCQEFMNDIIKVTSGQDDQDDEDDPTVLQKYLLEGRGWLLLYILYKNGVQSLSVSREFGKLLVSLLPWCLKFGTPQSSLSKPNNDLDRTLHPLTDCFCHLNKSAKWRKANKHREKAIPQFTQETNMREEQQENGQKRYKKQAPEKLDNLSSESDVEQPKNTERKLKHTSRRYYRYSYNPEPQTAAAHQNSNDEEEEEEIKLLISSTDVSVKHTASPQYLCSLIVDLILEISFLDLNQTSTSKVLCPTIMPNLLHIFSSFYPKNKADKSGNDELMAANWKNCDRIFFQRKLLRLILTLGGIIATQQNGVNILVGHKFTSVLLDLAQQVYGLHKIKAHLSVTSDKLASVMTNYPVDLVFMSEIVLGFLMCLDNVFMCLSLNLVHFQKAVHLVEDFDDNHGFELVEFIICLFDQSKTKSVDSSFEIDWLDEEPIKIVSSFLHTIKSVKVNYIHSMKCLKKKHQKCRYSFYFNHHHDILGLPVTQGEDSGVENVGGATPQVTICLVASWCGLFLDLLPKISSKVLQIEVLRVVCLSGICCCMSLESLVTGILGAMKCFSPAIRNHALEALNRVILELFSYNEEKSRTKSRQLFSCQNCMAKSAQKFNKIEEMQGYFAGEHVIDSGFSSRDQGKVNISDTLATSKWSVLDEYRTLLFSKDFSLAEVIAKHLYYLAIQGSVQLKEELFTRIYIHAFTSFLGNLKFHPQSSSEDDLPPKKEFSKEVKLHCLSALPYLLQVDSVLQTFLTKRGIGNICNLLEDYFLRAPVLKVFETLVFLDEQTLAQKLRQNEDLTASGQERNSNDGMVIKAFIDGLARKTDCKTKSNTVPQSSDTDSGTSDTASDLSSSSNWHDFSSKNLPVIVDMWESCERICLHSEKFVLHLKNSECLKIAERTLIYILDELLSTTKCDKTMEVLSEESEIETNTMTTAKNEGKIPAVCFMKLSLLRALLTICSACYLQLPKEYTQDGVQVKMWRTIKGSFHGFTTLPAAKLKTLFDVLLNAAMPKVSTILEYQHAKSIYQMFIKDDEIEDEEVRQLLQLSSDDENDSIFTTDRGYDADTECSSDRKEVKLSDSNTQRIYYASLFRLLIELLIESQQTTSGQEVLPIILLKLLQILRANQTAVMAVCNEGLLTDILTGFWKQLIENEETKDNSVRNSLLSLIQLLAQHRLTSHELQKILQLFHFSKIPKDLLLSTFMSVVENSTVQPYLSLKFPVKRKEKVHIAKNRFTKSSSFRNQVNSSSPSQSPSWKGFASTPELANDHAWMDITNNDRRQEDELKCWNVSAVFRTLKGVISWPPIETGFSLSIWLQFDRVQGRSRMESSTSSHGGYLTSSTECSTSTVSQGRQPTVIIPDCLHICSIGNKDKLFEIWSDCNSGYLLFRLTSESGDTEVVLKEAVAKEVISPGQWHHVMISYMETLESSKQNSTDENTNSAMLTGKVTLTVDGWRKHEITMDHSVQTLNARPKQESLDPGIFIGHTVDDPSDIYSLGHWSLGSVMLFKGTNIGNDACFQLYSLGPSCRSISKCDCSSDNVILTPNLTKQVVVHSNIQQDTLAGVKSISLNELRSSIQIHYSPWLPNHFCVYDGIMGRQEMSPALASNLGLPSHQRLDSLYLTQNPVIVKSLCNNAMSSQKHYSLEKAVMETGGLEAILFLTAKVYEVNHHDNHEKDQEHELLQAKALQLLFTLVNHSSALARDFVDCNGYCLLSKVLTSSRSVVGYQTLKVLMDASTTEPVFRTDPESGNLILRRKSEAMIKNVTVITDLILNWRIWEGAEEGVHVLLFLAVALLVREDHRYQRFNVIQFQSVNLISKIFCNYQERIQDGCPSFSPEISQCVISILQSMMGTPPDLHLIVAICDFLLLVHPAANTYISHSQSGFYFSLGCDTQSPPVSHWNQDIKNKQIHPANMSTPIKQEGDTEQESKHGSEKKKKLNFEEVEKFAKKEKAYPKLDELFPKTMAETEKSEKDNNDDLNVPPTIIDFIKGDKHKVTSEETCDSAESALDFNVDVTSNDVSENESKEQKSHSEIETVSDLEEAEGQTNVNKLKPGSSNMSLTLADFCEIEEGKYSVSLDAGSGSGGQSSHMFSDTDSEFSIIGMLAPKTEVHFDKNIEILEHEKGLIALCVGLLQTLVTIVVTLPDNLTDKVLQKIIKTEILIVLAHNSSPEIRTAVLRLLNAYLSRASSEHVENFIQKNRFHLLGAQLYQYPTHEEQLQEVMSLILGKPFCLQDRIDTNYINMNDLTEVQQSAIVLFLSVLENTVSDVALCHNALCISLQMFDGAPLIGSLMLEHGFLTVLCNMVVKINRSENSGTDLDGISENQILLEDLQTIICNIAVREFSASGTIHQQQFEEVLDFLYYIELKEQKMFGLKSVQVQRVKTLHLSVVLAILQYIEKASQENKHSSGWISRQPSSPNVSMENDLSAHFSHLSTSSLQTKKHHNFSTSSLHHTTTRSSQAALPQMKYSASTSVLVDPRLQDLRGGSPTSEFESSTSSLQSLYPPLSRSVSSESSKFPTSPKSGFSFPFRFGKKKRLQVYPASQSDLIDRFKKIIIASVDLIVFSNKEEIKRQPNEKKMILLYEKPQPVAIETSYIKRLFDFMYRAFEMTLAQDKNTSRRNRYVIMWGAKDVTRVQLGRLMVYMMSNKHDFDDRTYVMSYMLGESRGQEILKKLLTAQELGNEMAFYLHDLLTVWEDWCNTQQREDAYKFLNTIKRAGFTVVSPSIKPTHQELEYLREEKKQIDMNADRGRQVLQKKREPAFTRLLHKNDKLCTQLSALAMEVTQSVTQLQTLERNKFVEHIKRSMTKKIQIKKYWQQIVQNLTHERAVWYCPESYPRSWQLDPTEGPGRVRKRLKRCHLGIDSCFVSKEYSHNLDSEKHDPPLIYLFEDDHQISDSAALIYQLYKNEKIQHTYKCTAVAPNSESRGELLVGENSVFFVADEAISDANYTQVLLGNKDQLSMTWPYEDLREIHKRWFQLKDIGIEIFLTSGKTCLLACQSKQDRDSLYQHIKGLELPNLVETENLTLAEIQRSWVEGHMTNFDYLTHLNKLAGRSFNDLMQYPVFPFILKEYMTDDLNLKDPGNYRNLSKPISVQEKSREQKYLDNYRILEEEYKKADQDNISGMRVAPFHYGSHYSNSGSVLHFLVRLPPYTKMFLNFQDNNFDIPDRTFHSMQTTWRLASYQSTSDAKELIPEFFFLPEIFVNSEGFNFGQRQNGEVVWDIQLPPWCKSNPRLFTLIHRQALESDYVSQNLHNWLDLVFGSKQQGELAVKAINVFHPATYFGIDVNSVDDPVKRHALRTMVKTYGQTPKQLFRNPHPARMPSQALDNPVSSGVLTQLFQNSFSASSQMDQGHLPYIRSPINTVTSLKWGSYIGSPHLPPPTVVWQEKFESSVASLEASPTGDVFGVGADSFCLMMHSQQKVLRVFNSTDVLWAAIISWKHPDGILRIKNHKEKPLVNFIYESPTDQVTCCASVPDCRLLFVGGNSGLITIYQTVFNTSKESNIQVRGSKTVLHGHKSTVNCLVVCKPYSVLVSASDDHTCIIWDLNRLCYVRSIDSHKAGVKVVAVSPTLGDIASCSPQGMGSRLDLHTVNAELIATKLCDDTINCLAFSSAPEGKSVNIIAGGLSSGNIRIWSSWDLSHLRDLQQDNLIGRPVISLTFTHDSQRLYMSTSDGTVSLWESPPFGRLRPHNFTAFL